MKSAIYMEGKKFVEKEFDLEAEFEGIVKANSKMLFGAKTIYIDLKNKVDSKSLGATIPDGFLFDFRDAESPEFYLIEVELEKHDFYKHIFPQLTRFFAFFKNPASRDNLTERLFNFINTNPKIEEDFRFYLGKREIFKALKDIIENSQNILLIIDENKPELTEVFETYTDTWGKMVKVEILKQYTAEKRNIFTLNPDFEGIEIVQLEATSSESEQYDEQFHLGGVEIQVANAYKKIKDAMLSFDSSIKINPQKYYISFWKKKNFAFFRIRKKKLHIALMLPFDWGKINIRKHSIKEYPESVQRFYNGPCFRITIENETEIDEVIAALREASLKQKE